MLEKYRGRVGLHNVAALLEGPAGPGSCMFSRVPEDVRRDLNERAQGRALEASGSEIRFNLCGEQATIVLQMDERPAIAEVYAGPFLIDWHIVGTSPTPITITQPTSLTLTDKTDQLPRLAFDPALFRVVLPWRPVVQLLEINGEVAPPRSEQFPSLRYLAYGSSITQGNLSVKPTDSFAAQTARILGVDLVNLGFGGSAHCEPCMADYIAVRDDWNFATLEIGINMIQWMPVNDFVARASAFISTVSQAQNDRWVFVIDMFPYYDDVTPGQSRQHEFRQIIHDIVKDVNHPRLIHVSGPVLLARWDALAADLLHPTPYGMALIAERLSALIQEVSHALPLVQDAF